MNVVGFGSRAIPWNRKDCGNQVFRGLLRFWEGYGLKAQTLYRVECLNGASCFRSRKTWNNHQRFQKVTGNCFPRSQSRSNHINFDSLSKQQHSRNILTYYNISKNPIYQHPSRNQNRPKVIWSISLSTECGSRDRNSEDYFNSKYYSSEEHSNLLDKLLYLD